MKSFILGCFHVFIFKCRELSALLPMQGRMGYYRRDVDVMKRNGDWMKCTVQDDIDVWPSAPLVVLALVRILIRLRINIIIITFYPH